MRRNAYIRITGLVLVCAALSATTPVQAREGFYGVWYAGYSDADDHSFRFDPVTSVKTELDPGYGLAGGIGYDYGTFGGRFGARVEFELSYRENEVDVHTANTVSGPLPGSNGDPSTLAIMVNTFLDYPTQTAFTPYLGVGLGMANVHYTRYSSNLTGDVLDDDDDAFAYQFLAGTSYQLTEQIDLTADYRYFEVDKVEITTEAGLSTKSDFQTHNLFVGMRYRFP